MNKKLVILAVASTIFFILGNIINKPIDQLYGTTYYEPTSQFSYSICEDVGWWNTSWDYRKEITIDHTKVANDLDYFPVLISISDDGDLAANAQPDGDDICFVDSCNINKYNHEIEYFFIDDGDLAALIAWVLIPHLLSTSDTTIYMYYGNATCGSQQNVEGTWNSAFKMVHHLEDVDPVSISDSTSNDNDGIGNGEAALTSAGKIDGAYDFDGTGDYITVSSLDNGAGYESESGEFTVSLWFKTSATSRSLISDFYQLKGSMYGWHLYIDANGHLTYTVGVLTYITGTTLVNTNTWFHVVVVDRGQTSITGKNTTIYLNGAIEKDSSRGAQGISSNRKFSIGTAYTSSGYTSYFDGTIDEVRLSNTGRTEAWINTSYQNINNADFMTIGDEVPRLTTVSFDSTASDGTISKMSATYAGAHDATSGTVTATSTSITIGQYFSPESADSYIIYRGYVFFDTSSIPDTATITSATLSLYGQTDSSIDADFDITIQIGITKSSPHDPLVIWDYYYNNYTGNGGSKNTASFITTGYNDITMNATGRGEISKTGTTKLCIRSSRDINSIDPGAGGSETEKFEYITVYAQEQGTGYKPKLTVVYSE